MLSECEIRAYLKGGALFSIGFCFPYILLSAYVKKSNPRAFRYLLAIPVMTALHTLTYVPKDLEKCRAQQQQQQQQKQQQNSVPS